MVKSFSDTWKSGLRVCEYTQLLDTLVVPGEAVRGGVTPGGSVLYVLSGVALGTSSLMKDMLTWPSLG